MYAFASNIIKNDNLENKYNFLVSDLMCNLDKIMLNAVASKPPNLSDLIPIYFSLIKSTWIFVTCFLPGESGSSFFHPLVPPFPEAWRSCARVSASNG